MDEFAELTAEQRLTIVRRIASGGMGAVYLAVQHGAAGFSKTVAVKTILDAHARHAAFVERFIDEAKLVADLVHQNIAQVYQLGRSGETLYIVMEYVNGVDLRRFVARHRQTGRAVPPELAAFIVSRICRGLEYAHRKTGVDGTPLGIVHRDVSTSNVMLNELGETKILDFGIARVRRAGADPRGEGLIGKVPYMSPEQAARQPLDHRSDLYSTGLVLWELLAGRHPLDGCGSAAGMLERLRNEEIEPVERVRPGLPEALARIVGRALRRDLGARYQEAGRMGYDLEYLIYHQGYGPTIVTLQRYLQELFPERGTFRAADGRTTSMLPDTIAGEPGDGG